MLFSTYFGYYPVIDEESEAVVVRSCLSMLYYIYQNHTGRMSVVHDMVELRWIVEDGKYLAYYVNNSATLTGAAVSTEAAQRHLDVTGFASYSFLGRTVPTSVTSGIAWRGGDGARLREAALGCLPRRSSTEWWSRWVVPWLEESGAPKQLGELLQNEGR